MNHKKTSRPPVYTIFFAFLKLGMTAFGGPAMVAFIRDLCVKKNQWVSDNDFRDGVALVQTLPGATAMQAAAYAGVRASGPKGALAAYIGFGLPAFLLMSGLTTAYQHGNDIKQVISFFSGLQLIVIAMVAKAAMDFGRKTVKSWQDAMLTAAGALYIIADGSPVTVIIISALAAPILYRNMPVGKRDDEERGQDFKSCRDLNSAGNHTLTFGLLATLTVSLMLVILYMFDRGLFQLSWIMLKIDLFAFGGGYASLPMMLHELVQSNHLLDAKTLMDGIALGQITPGPIVITATFAGLLLQGMAGAVVATISIFSPSFIILIITTPWFDRIRHSIYLKMAMRGILCSFTGLLIAVATKFAMATDWTLVAAVICAGSFTALILRINILWVALAGGVISIFIL